MVAVLEVEHPVKQYLRAHISLLEQIGQTNEPLEFILRHGRDFNIGPDSYKGKRWIPQQCFSNCTHLALEKPDLFYVEGFVACYGVSIHHAWLTNAKGELIDPTMRDDPESRLSHYFGVVFNTDYVKRTTMKNKVYGLLDGYHNRKTLPALLEGKSKWKPKGFMDVPEVASG